jgi:signal transduction histidine kinase
MRIRQKILWNILISVSIILCLGFLNLATYWNVDRNILKARYIQKLENEVFKETNLLNDYIIFEQERARQQWWKQHLIIFRLLNKKSPDFNNNRQENLLFRMRKSNRTISKLFRSYQLTSSDFQKKRIISRINTENFKQSSTLDELAIISHDKLMYSGDKYLIVSLITIVLLIVIVIIGSVFIKTSVLKPMKEFSLVVGSIRQGNFGNRVSIHKKDEFGELADTFNDMMNVVETAQQREQQQKNAKEQFINIASHDLKNPLLVIKLYLEMLRSGEYGSLYREQEHIVEIVEENAKYIETMITDILDLSKMESGKLPFNVEETDIRKLTDKVVKLMKPMFDQKNQRVICDFEKIPNVKTDPERMIQVLRNLLSNAQKHAPENSEIKICILKKGKEVLIGVKDFGQGIDKEEQEKIFGSFYKSRENHQEGSGLGLSIVKGIMETHGGRVWVESEKGKGSAFFVAIPL